MGLLDFIVRPQVLLAVGLLSAHCVWGYGLQGRVVAIADGDTITVLDAQNQQHKIRLAGIDAPEKGQPFGQVPFGHLSDLVFGKSVMLDCGKTDRYKREICIVLIDGQEANLAQVRAGMAWWYRKYQNEQTAQQRAAYEAAEAAAKAGRMGLWRDAGAVPPWEWRKAGREN
jgi:endonuclease YncB( thermonuclease family)